MDLPLYARVLWRFRFVMLLGLLLAVALALLAKYSVSFDGSRPHLTQRGTHIWQSNATVVLTQNGFPAGYVPGTSRVDPLSFTQLAATYARLAVSDEALLLYKKHGAPGGASLSASAVADIVSGQQNPLPMVSLFGTAPTLAEAQKMTEVGVRTFIEYIADRQEQSKIPENRRVLLQVVNHAQPGILIKGPKKILPVVVFMTVLFAAIALVFVLENLRPAIRVVSTEEAEALKRTDVRRLA